MEDINNLIVKIPNSRPNKKNKRVWRERNIFHNEIGKFCWLSFRFIIDITLSTIINNLYLIIVKFVVKILVYWFNYLNLKTLNQKVALFQKPLNFFDFDYIYIWFPCGSHHCLFYYCFHCVAWISWYLYFLLFTAV